MFKKYLIMLLAALLACLCLTATAEVNLPAELETIEAGAFEGDTDLTGRVDLPDIVRSIGDRAFASTNVYALGIPFSCEYVGANVLAGSDAAYMYIPGYDTVLADGAANGVSYVFANPYNEHVRNLPNFVDANALYICDDNIYYEYTSDGTMRALCPYAPEYLWCGSTLTIPKITDYNCLVTDVSGLVLPHCDDITTVEIPSYLELPSIPGKKVVHYNALTVTTPLPDGMLEIGTPATISVDVMGAYGDVTFNWTFTNGTTVTRATTTEPTVVTTPTHDDFAIEVVVTDALGDTATASVKYSLAFDESVTYRALLVGNTYPGEYSALDGPDNDAYAMKKMLAMWPRTPYSSNVQINVTTNSIISSIASTFAGADSNDVSLFFYSGHGTPEGSLCGISSTYLSVSELRECLDRIPGTKIVMLDCCYSGAHINKGDAPSAADFNRAVIRAFSSQSKGNLATDGYIVLTASSKDQTSSSLGYVGSDFWFGAFTYGVCYGSGYDMVEDETCTAWADANSDAQISLSECYHDAMDTVKNTLGREQDIQYFGDSDYILWRK